MYLIAISCTPPQLKKLQEDIAKLRRQLKQLAQKEGAAKAGSRMADGDHAILSSKPLFGLRCMSCDRWGGIHGSGTAVVGAFAAPCMLSL